MRELTDVLDAAVGNGGTSSRLLKETAVVRDDEVQVRAPLLSAQQVRRALSELSADHRRVLIEVYYRRLGASEAAGRLGVPTDTVKSRTYHALHALRAALHADQTC